jgi:hypothetical protein
MTIVGSNGALRHTFPIRIHSIQQARLLDLVNKPEKRARVDGSFYTPTVVTFDCGQEKIHIYLEDVEAVVQTLAGVCIYFINKEKVSFTCL